MTRPHALSGCLLAIASGGTGHAQTLPFEVWGLREGLPQSQAETLAQDHDGYLWVGTLGGLARFNGRRFDSYSLEDGLPSNYIHELLVDRSGTLWVATRLGLVFRNGQRFTSVTDPSVARARCRALAEDAAGRLWIGTDRGLVRRDGEGFVRVPSAKGESVGTVRDILPDGDGVVVATDHGLWRTAPAVVPLPAPPAAVGILRAVARTAEGLWVGSSASGLFLLGPVGWTHFTTDELPARSVYHLLVTRSGTLYVASQDAGLFVRPPGSQRFDRLSRANGLPSNEVNSTLEDNQGILWVATGIGGLARLRNSGVRNYGVREGFPQSSVRSIGLAATPGEMWFSTASGGVRARVTPTFRVLETLTTRSGLADDAVWKIIAAPQGELWVMTDGAFHVRPPGAAWLRPLPASLPVPRTEVYDFTLDSAGRVWLAGGDPRASLAMRDGVGVWHHWNQAQDGSRVPICRNLAPRRAGGVWVAADARLLESDGRELRPWPEPLPLPPSSHIGAMYEDRQGRLWIGGESGLARRETTGRWGLLNDTPAFTSRHVYSIGEDHSGGIWVGTTRGTFRFGPDDRVEPFGLESGLPGLETNQHGFFADADGGVWIGTVDGASRVEPRALAVSSTAPPLVVEAADLPSRRIEFPRQLDLGWHERSPTFHVAVLAFGGRRNDSYRARLDPMEPDWLPVRRSGELRYTNLAQGSYRLLLEAARDDGGWGPTQTLSLRVHPPFWRTTWFALLTAVLLVALLLAVFRWRTRMLRARAAELEARVAERTLQLSGANRGLEEAQAKIARLVETAGEAQEHLESWAQGMARDIARGIGAREIGAFRFDGDHSVPLTSSRVSSPTAEQRRRVKGAGTLMEDEGLLVPIVGASGDVLGTLVVASDAHAWGETELHLLRGFAHQLGGAIEMRTLRQRLASVEQSRSARRQEMEARGELPMALCSSCLRCYQSTLVTCPDDGATLSTPMLVPFRVGGRYRLERVLGQGGMGTIFLATDEQLAREVALKLLRPDRFDDATSRLRFTREAQLLAQIQHPGVTALYDAGHLDDGSAFLIMERLRGLDLATLLGHFGPGRPEQVAALLRHAAAAHRAGILHRDLKPANLLLTAAKRGFGVKLMDFGIAKPLADMQDITVTGNVVGTPSYMSPEQVSNAPLSPRSDLYALATVVFEALCGRRAVEATGLGKAFTEILSGHPPSLKAVLAGASDDLDAVFGEALARNPDQRPADIETWAETVAQRLERMPSAVIGWPEPLPTDLPTPGPDSASPAGDILTKMPTR